jgi:hypothetical protein
LQLELVDQPPFSLAGLAELLAAGFGEQQLQAHVRQPAADALLAPDRHPRRVDLALEGGGAFELLLARPRLHGRQAQRETLERDGEARVHEEAADRVHPEPAGSVPAAVHAVGDADRLRVLALQRELGRVLDDQDQAIGRGEAAVVVAVGINSGGRREVLGPASSADILPGDRAEPDGREGAHGGHPGSLHPGVDSAPLSTGPLGRRAGQGPSAVFWSPSRPEPRDQAPHRRGRHLSRRGGGHPPARRPLLLEQADEPAVQRARRMTLETTTAPPGDTTQVSLPVPDARPNRPRRASRPTNASRTTPGDTIRSVAVQH